MKEFTDTLKESLANDNSDRNRKMWANHIIDEDIDINSLIGVLEENTTTAMRFSWMLGDICEISPKTIVPMLQALFEIRSKLRIKGYDRSLSKWFRLCGVPERIEGEVSDQLFKWLADPAISVSTKSNSMIVLFELSNKYPEIKRELQLTINGQLANSSSSFRKKANYVLEKLVD